MVDRRFHIPQYGVSNTEEAPAPMAVGQGGMANTYRGGIDMNQASPGLRGDPLSDGAVAGAPRESRTDPRPVPCSLPGEPRPFSLNPVFDRLKPEGFDSEPYVGHRRSQRQVAVLALRFGVDRQSVYPWDLQGLSANAADAIAIRLGVHPSAIWPDWFSHAPDDEDMKVFDVREKERLRNARCRENRRLRSEVELAS